MHGIESIRGTNSDDVYTAVGFSTSSANAGSGLNAGAFNGLYFEFNDFEGGLGNDDVTGNGGTRVTYQNSGGAVNVNLATGATGAAGTDSFHGGISRPLELCRHLTGTDNPTRRSKEGLAGNDNTDGRGSTCELPVPQHRRFRRAQRGSLNRDRRQWTATAGVGTDTLVNIEAVRGTNASTPTMRPALSASISSRALGNDTITGNGSTRIMYHHA